MGLGWILDVALHPNYEQNGWVYIQFGDRCRKARYGNGSIAAANTCSKVEIQSVANRHS